jgi:hypothetical protein
VSSNPIETERSEKSTVKKNRTKWANDAVSVECNFVWDEEMMQ